MNDRESQAIQKAQNLFRKEKQKKDGALAWMEYAGQPEAIRLKTDRLRALRLARDAAAAPAPKSARKARSR